MANRKRNIQMKFYVTEEEKRLIDEKMAQLPTRRYGAYLRKMAIDGYNRQEQYARRCMLIARTFNSSLLQRWSAHLWQNGMAEARSGIMNEG